MDWNAMVLVGWVVRPHGRRGQVVVEPETDFPVRRYQAGAVLYAKRPDDAEAVPLTIEDSWPHQGRWVIGFAGLESIDDAESWRDAELRVPESALETLQTGTFWVHDLVGCEVVTIGGQSVGRVRRVDLSTGVPLLELDEAGEALIPFVDAICRSIDTAGRTITIDPPDGLIALNRKKA